MGLAALAVRYRPIVFTMVGLLMFWGVYAYFTMPRREDPEFTIRVCVVQTAWPGASAVKVEELITDKIEEAVNSIEEVDVVRSTTLSGQSTVFVELDDNIAPADIPNVWDKVRARVDQVPMPDVDVKPVVNDEFGDTAVLVLAVHQTPSHDRDQVRPQDRYTLRQLEEFADTIRDELRLLPGVGKVDKFGVRNEAIFIETTLGNWSQLNLTTQSLRQLAQERNIIEPGGQLNTRSGVYSIIPGGEFNAITEIEQIASVVTTSQGDNNNVYLSELGLTVKRDYEDPPRYICRYGDVNGSVPCVSLGITMKSGANIIDICDRSKGAHSAVN